jgi:hypothetical protein
LGLLLFLAFFSDDALSVWAAGDSGVDGADESSAAPGSLALLTACSSSVPLAAVLELLSAPGGV